MKLTAIAVHVLPWVFALSPAVAQDTPAAHRLGPVELRVWSDPEFQRQVVQSYMAETDIEPRLTANELKQMQKIVELISSNQLDKAVAALEKQRGDAASAVFDFTLGNILFQREELEQAAALYEAAAAKHPKFRRAWRNLAIIRVRQNDFQKALPALTRVIELGGSDAITYGLLGFSYSSIENDLSAETAYRMAILLDPETVDWKMGLARSFFKQRRYADATAITDLLLAKEPDRADLWMLQANAYLGLEKPLRAAENLELVDRLGKSTTDTLNMLGDIYVNQELFDLAVGSYGRALVMDGNVNPDRAVRAAKVLAARGALAETRKLLDAIDSAAAGRVPDASRKEMLKLRARVAVADGAGGEEVRVLEEIVALDPLDGEALILLGQQSARSGDTDKAVFYYERAAAMESFEAEAKVRHAQLLVGKGRYDEALPLLRRAQAIKPRDNVQEYLVQVERVAKAR